MEVTTIHPLLDGYTFRGNNCHFYICFYLKEGLILKEKNLLLWSKFFPLRVNPILGGLCQLREQTQEVTKVCFLL